MSLPSHRIRPGGLSTADHDTIAAMAGRGRTACTIARSIEKHPSTVYWFMLTNGLVTVKPRAERGGTYLRKGRPIRRFCAAEDALILAERRTGAALRDIATTVEARFGHRRTVHSLQVRLVMLACCDEFGEPSTETAVA